MKLDIQLFGGRGQNSSGKNTKYQTSKRVGFGEYNKNNIPVYKGKIDYTGNFGFDAKLSTLTSKELQKAYEVQQEKLQEAYARPIGDQRTKNGRMDKIFRQAQINQYEKGVERIDKEIQKRKRKNKK